MSFWQELNSFRLPEAKTTQPAPEIGPKAPWSDCLQPSPDGRPTVITFLRHCGCPCSYKNRGRSACYRCKVRFVAVSHSDQGTTDRWLDAVASSEGVEILVDADRTVFAQWRLGLSSFGHFLSPASLPTESGNRWQTSGSFAVDHEGIVKWGRAMRRANEVPNFGEAVERLN
ncbi:hypothetical protein B0H19DRAFT_1196949, partial [Mycena capillaripes]